MHSKAKPPTKAERKRMALIVEKGCVCCLTEHDESLHPVEVNHHLDGGVRIGHHATTAECAWHHRGIPPEGFNAKQATEMFGPSRKLDGKAFHEAYGTDEQLLAFQESILRH